MKNVLLVCIALFLMYCQPEEKKDKVRGVETDTVKLPLEYAIIEPDSSYLKYWFTGYAKSVNLTDKDLSQIEKLMINAFLEKAKNDSTSGVILNSKSYLLKRQYVSYINEKGGWIVWVNALCKIPEIPVEKSSGEYEFQEMDWKNKIVQVDDGGSCFWQMTIDLNTRKCEISVNGT